MKHFSHPIALLAAALTTSGMATQPTLTEEQALETIYWGEPDKDYVSTAWPIEEGSDLIDIREVPRLERGFVLTAPEDRGDGIIVGELGVDGGNKEMIVALAQEISGGQHGNIDSLLISHKGKLLFESYFNSGRINLTHPQASATKSYTSMVLGRAIQLGYLTMADLDKPIIEFLGDVVRDDLVDGAELVTLRHALTMRSGIRISDEQIAAFENEPVSPQGQAMAQALFEKSEPITAEKLNAFSYGNFASLLVMQVIEAVVPGTAEDFIKTELLGKMDIPQYGWMTDLGGLPAGGWGSSVTSRDMVKFGTLAMNNGKLNGEQLISKAYLAEATSRILTVGDDDIFGGGKDVSNQGYGFFWWSGDLKSGEKTYFSRSAQGGGGQFIVLLDELDLIVVFTSSERNPTNLQIVAERILPAFLN